MVSCYTHVDVLECLRAVAPPSGQLTFEVFVRGLQESLTSRRQQAKSEHSHSPRPSKPIKLQHRSESSPFIQVQLRAVPLFRYGWGFDRQGTLLFLMQLCEPIVCRSIALYFDSISGIVI